MSFWDKLKYWLLTGLCTAIGWLPTWFLYYPFLEVIYFLLYRIFRYRVKVVRSNLLLAFPEKSDGQRRKIESKFYRQLAEIFVDTIDLTGISAKELQKRMQFGNLEWIENQMQGQDWIAALAHYGSWEYFNVYQLRTSSHILGAYHPLKDKGFDMFYKKSRSRFGMEPVAVNVLLRTYLASRKQEQRQILGMISDQTPTIFYIDHWYRFLNQHTGFYSGMEKISMRFGLPVVFLRVNKTSRAHYQAWFEIIYDGKEEVSEHEITARYAARLEEMIRQSPELWMWSHRRWKHKPGPGWELNVEL